MNFDNGMVCNWNGIIVVNRPVAYHHSALEYTQPGVADLILGLSLNKTKVFEKVGQEKEKIYPISLNT